MSDKVTTRGVTCCAAVRADYRKWSFKRVFICRILVVRNRTSFSSVRHCTKKSQPSSVFEDKLKLKNVFAQLCWQKQEKRRYREWQLCLKLFHVRKPKPRLLLFHPAMWVNVVDLFLSSTDINTNIKVARDRSQIHLAHTFVASRTRAKMIFIFQKVQSFALYSLLVLVFCLGTLLRVFPFFKRLMSNAIDAMFGLKMPQDDYWDSMFSRQMLTGLWRFIFLDINKKTKLGTKAYNSPLVSLDGKTYCRLLDSAKQGRPLVVNFGSSSWRPFLSKFRDFSEIVRDFSDFADFVIVYIEEAHPSDGWALKVSLFISGSLQIFYSRNIHRFISVLPEVISRVIT